MEVKNCKSCRRLFNWFEGEQLCDECKKEANKKFDDVKDYIREHPTANLNMIAEATDVTVRQLQQWVREERLEFTADSHVTFNCEKCGEPIRTGRFCDKCKGGLSHGFGSMYQSATPAQPQKREKDKDRMRFLQS